MAYPFSGIDSRGTNCRVSTARGGMIARLLIFARLQRFSIARRDFADGFFRPADFAAISRSALATLCEVGLNVCFRPR